MSWRLNVPMYGTAVMLSAVAVYLTVCGPFAGIGQIGASAVSGFAACLGMLIGGLIGIAWEDRKRCSR